MKTPIFVLTLMLSGCGGGGMTGGSPAVVQSAPPPVVAKSGPTVFMGDSITALWALPDGIVDVGISGQTSPTMLARFKTDVLALNPGIVEILAGTNDVFLLDNPNIDSVAEMAEEAAASGACVIVSQIPPNSYAYFSQITSVTSQAEADQITESFNAQIKTLAATYGYKLADYHTPMVLPDGSQNAALFKDGVHPNDDGYAMMWSVVDPLIQECQAGH